MKNIFIALSILIISSCSVDIPLNSLLEDSGGEFYLPFITTMSPQNVSIDQATISGHIELAPLSAGDGGNSNEIESKGFIWGLDEDLTLENGTKVSFNGDPGNYSTTLENLSPETKYYFNTYATNAENRSKLGSKSSFTTAEEAPCNYEEDNYLRPVYELYDRPFIPDAITLTDPDSYGAGNLEFEASSSNSIVRIFIRLNEIDANLPLSGIYKGVYNFDNSSTPSSNGMRITIQDYNGNLNYYPQGASNNAETEIYIENNGEKVSFIFCDVEIGEYVLTGKFSYDIPE